MNDYPPVELVNYAATQLGDLLSEVVFLGGAVVGLLVTEPGSRPPRPTKDVDVAVEVSSLVEFYALDKALLAKGFLNDATGPICRYLHGSIKLDVMPAHAQVLGFTNRWYAIAFETSQPYVLANGLTINLVSTPCFLSTKLEAFHDPKREGHHDLFASRDFEDIVSVVDGRPSIVKDVSEAPQEIRAFLSHSFLEVLQQDYLEEAIAGYVDAGREDITANRIRSIVAL